MDACAAQKSLPNKAIVSLFRRRPTSAAAVRAAECTRAAAPGNMAGTDHRDAVVIADRTCGAVGAYGSGHAFADDPAAGHDHRAGAGAAAADGIDDPRAVEIATATAAAFPRSAARRGVSASGSLRLARSGSADRGVEREPDTDFSSLPILPPALPDCANAAPAPFTMIIDAQSRAILIERRTAFAINRCFQFLE